MTTTIPVAAAAPADVPGHMHPLSFIARLEWRLEHDPPSRKADRTRERLKLAAARILDDKGFHDLKAGDVSALAGLAEGSFYLYFTDKRDITRAVLGEFQTMYFGGGSSRGAASPNAFDSIRAANLIWFAFARSNAGLFRCMYQFADEDAAFGAALQQTNLRWHQKILRSLPQHDTARVSDEFRLLLIYLLGGMMDDLARRMIVYPDPQLQAVLTAAGADDATLADITALVWLRLLRPLDPPPASQNGAHLTLITALFPAVPANN